MARKVGDVSSVAELLWSAEHFSAAENRKLESMLREMGLKTIPQLIRVAREPAAPFHARSLAVRSLSRLSLPQLLLIADDLLGQELSRAEHALAAHRSLVVRAGDGLGQAVLSRYYRDAAAEGLEFVLELLSLIGKLPDFELIRAMLSFANPRDRANAIETIEQSCSRSLFARIQGLIQSTVSDSGLVVVESDAHLSAEQILRNAAQSDVPLEVTAGILSLHEARLADGATLVKERLEHRAHARLSECFVSMLTYFAERERGTGGSEHPLHRLHSLIQAAFFGDTRIMAIEFLAHHGSWQAWQAGETVYAPGDDAESLFVLARGEVTLSAEGREQTVGAGATFGQRVLMGEEQRQEFATTSGCQCVVLSAATVMRGIEVFPSLGVGLYQFKTQPALAL